MQFIGNIKFRSLVDLHRERYHKSSRAEKSKVVLEVVQLWRQMSPPGRFLAPADLKLGGASPWNDTGDKLAQKKTAKRLRETLPEESTSAGRADSASTVSVSSKDNFSNNSSSSSSMNHCITSVGRISNGVCIERAAKRARQDFQSSLTTVSSSGENPFFQVSADTKPQQDLNVEDDFDIESLFDESSKDMPTLDSFGKWKMTTYNVASTSISYDLLNRLEDSWMPVTAIQGGSILEKIARSIPSAAVLTEGLIFDS